MSFLSVKVVLISTGILSMAMGLKLTVPMVSHFIISEAPFMWNLLLTCFTPPYLYILLNFIILSIVASSKFNNQRSPPPDSAPLLPNEPLIYPGTPAPVQIPAPEPVNISVSDYNGVVSAVHETMLNDVTVAELGNVSGSFSKENTPAKTKVITDEEILTPSFHRMDSLDFAFNNENEKPPVSTRFSHRKAVRASPEGGKVVSLGVTKAKKQETLESTWRTITEGRPMPLTRHLKKSETWETQPRRNGVPLADLNGGPMMKKSETFSGREKSTASPGSGGRLRKEPSLSQDELNRRVEAFINKFNAEMRLQRQESLRQYREMINRGS